MHIYVYLAIVFNIAATTSKTLIAREALVPLTMDNLMLRRMLVMIGILILLIGSILLTYGVFKNNNTYIIISIVGVVVSYLISKYVIKLQKESRKNK